MLALPLATNIVMTISSVTPAAAALGCAAACQERGRVGDNAATGAKGPLMTRWPMRSWLLTAMLCGCIGLPAAHAQAGYSGDRLIVAQRDRDRDAQRRDNRRNDQRERRREADRQQRDALTPDEHRDLNRDLERANREIYRKGRDRR